MNLNTKLDVLNEIYRIHSRFTAPLPVSCARCCSTCCTQNVTMTTLEGVFILNHATSSGERQLLDGIAAKPQENRFVPETTLNHLARLCAEGKEIPEEKDHSPDGKCLLLKDDLCSIYPARPFGCRCFLSKRDCRETGFADMDPFVLTVNTLFLQFIEHLDAGGLSGNLTDILLFLQARENIRTYEDNNRVQPEAFLVRNRPITTLLIPPEHQNRVADIRHELNILFSAHCG